MSSACLDSWVVLRWLEGVEPAASFVDDVLPARPLMSWINLGEVSYVLERVAGPQAADETVRELRRLLTLEVPGEGRVLEAARVKARHRMAYADAFAVATAGAHGLPLATGDPEILDAGTNWSLIDLRG